MLSLAVSYKVLSPEADSDLGARYLISLEAEGSIRAAEEKSLRGFQSAANACVSDPRSRRIGLRSIALLAQQSSDEFFSSNSKSWTTTAAQHLKPAERPVTVTEACRLISALLRRSPAFPDASRHFSSIAPNLLTSLANCADISNAAPRCLFDLASAYPGSCGQGVGAIEKLLTSWLNGDKNNVSAGDAARLYSVLPRLGGGGRDGVHHRERWSKQLSSFLSTLHNLAVDILGISPSFRTLDKVDGALALPKCRGEDLLEKAHLYSSQFEAASSVLREMLRSGYPTSKDIPLTAMRSAFDVAVLRPSLSQCLSSSQVEDHVLAAALPRMWSEALRTLSELVNVCGEDCLPIVGSVLGYCLKVLNEVGGDDYSRADCLKRHGPLKADVCRLVRVLCTRLGAGSGMHLCGPELISLLLREVIPFREVMSLTLNAKGRKKGKSSTSSKALSRKSRSASPEACAASLEAIEAIVESCGGLLRPSLHKDLSCAVVGLCLEVQGFAAGSRPAPYDSAECRVRLYGVLKSLLLNFNLRWATPLAYAVKIFQHGRNSDGDLGVSRFCGEAALTAQSIAQPRSATLHVETPIGAKELEQVKGALMSVHFAAARRGGEAAWSERLGGPAGREGPSLFDAADSDKRIGPETTGEVAENGTAADVAEKSKPGPSRDLPDPPKRRRVQEEEKPVSLEDFNITAEKQEAAMKMFYDFSGEAVVIPEEVRNRPRKVPSEDKGKEQRDDSASEEAKGPEIDLQAVMQSFVNESSSSDEEEEDK